MHILFIETDLLDKQIIDLLMEDARRSSKVLSKHLNVNSSTIRRRIKRLVEKEIIQIVAFPEPDKVGLHTEAIIALSVSHENSASVLEKLRGYPEVRWAAAMSGRFDIMAYVWLPTTDDLYKFIRVIGGIEGVTQSETSICLHVYKRP
ncbi:Lrp/AsnC family transcriptional regulator [Chloroflexota bacterium]